MDQSATRRRSLCLEQAAASRQQEHQRDPRRTGRHYSTLGSSRHEGHTTNIQLRWSGCFPPVSAQAADETNCASETTTKVRGNRTGAPRSPQRTWAEKPPQQDQSRRGRLRSPGRQSGDTCNPTPEPTTEDQPQKLKDTCRSILRFEEGDEKNPPARAFDFPNNGDSRTPTGAARFTLLNMFLPMAVKFSE